MKHVLVVVVAKELKKCTYFNTVCSSIDRSSDYM